MINYFSYMGSTFFSSASIGSVSTVILFLTTFLPYIIVVALGTTLTSKYRFITVSGVLLIMK